MPAAVAANRQRQLPCPGVRPATLVWLVVHWVGHERCFAERAGAQNWKAAAQCSMLTRALCDTLSPFPPPHPTPSPIHPPTATSPCPPQGVGAPCCARILTSWFAAKERGTYWGEAQRAQRQRGRHSACWRASPAAGPGWLPVGRPQVLAGPAGRVSRNRLPPAGPPCRHVEHCAQHGRLPGAHPGGHCSQGGEPGRGVGRRVGWGARGRGAGRIVAALQCATELELGPLTSIARLGICLVDVLGFLMIIREAASPCPPAADVRVEVGHVCAGPGGHRHGPAHPRIRARLARGR